MIRWLALHTAAWEFFVVSVPILVAGTVVAQERNRADLVPYWFLLSYLAVCLWAYVASDIGRFVAFDFPRWASMLVTLFAASAIPLVAGVATVTWGHRHQLPAGRRAVMSVMAGVVTIPLVSVLSELLFTMFAPWFTSTGF